MQKVVHWLLEKDTFLEGNPERMAQLIQAQGDQAHTLSYIPFGAPIPVDVGPKECVIIYGSINLIRALFKQYSWTPAAWFDPEILRCTSYLTHWQAYSVQQHHAFFTFGSLPYLKRDLYTHYGDSVDGHTNIFIRPDNNLKTFTGQVVEWAEFDRWYNREKDCYTPDPTSLVLVSKPSLILRECRFVVSEGKVLTGATYKERHSPVSFARAQVLAQKIAQDSWQPLPIYVMDICETLSGFNLLEIGSVNCAGLYTCDLSIVIETMRQLALKEWQDIYGE